ncbi:uncharacterized protein MELLADRAFT_123766 [Melampsora larici-populina 98AG31]|uniref:Secreted protein n=1 Tax=Melampsora larici-populina (strain 98AG31 / pathotype 3-4-7) TaxID=747676 RepID=F4R3V3_MELLP|nr:uncharacterized protein MELLADRAFT_123766 [Melampsora larici-populina 98AG31]EGG13098.1 secreted protein [Melampsora larici-populina 98AG31]
MFSFDSLLKLQVLIFFIAISITQLTSIEAVTVQCIKGFGVKDPKEISGCNDKDFNPYVCMTRQCGRDGLHYTVMKGCVFEGLAGTSEQQCVSYNPTGDKYECYNSGHKKYLCPYIASNVPYITCTNCRAAPPPRPAQPIG